MPQTFEQMCEDPAILFSSHQACSTRPSRRPRARANARIVEVVCCDLLHQLAADQPPPLQYYLALRGGDPDAVLLHRVQAVVPEIAPRSQCRVSARAGVIDRATGVPGALLEVTRVSWLRATAVDVIAGYYATPWHAAAFRYRVKADGGQWMVASGSELWKISPPAFD